MRHVYVHDENVINPSKMREEALARLTDKYTVERNGTEHTLIHFHRHGEFCDARQHEYARINKEGSAELIQFTGQLGNIDG